MASRLLAKFMQDLSSVFVGLPFSQATALHMKSNVSAHQHSWSRALERVECNCNLKFARAAPGHITLIESSQK